VHLTQTAVLIGNILTARWYPSADCAVTGCLSVRPSVCPADVTRQFSVETAKHIVTFFSPSGSHIILVFLYQTVWQYSDGTFERGHKMQGHEKVSIFGQYLALSRKWYKTESYLQEFKLDWIAKT